MITKGKALDLIEGVSHFRVRKPFSISFLTANREGWKSKKFAKKKLAQLIAAGGAEEDIAALNKKIAGFDVGGRLIEHNECVRSAARGMHAKQQSEKIVDGVVDRRRSHFHTKNIVFLPGDNIRKVHNDLIMEVNGVEVLY